MKRFQSDRLKEIKGKMEDVPQAAKYIILIAGCILAFAGIAVLFRCVVVPPFEYISYGPSDYMPKYQIWVMDRIIENSASAEQILILLILFCAAHLGLFCVTVIFLLAPMVKGNATILLFVYVIFKEYILD